MPPMDRQRGKSSRRRDARPPRRTPPPPRTGLEAEFLDETKRAGTQLVVTLADGTTLCGTVQDHNRDQITLEDSSGPIVIRKAEIRYLYEDE